VCTVDLRRGYKRYEGVLAQAVERSPRGSSASAQCAGRSNFRCCALVDHGRFGPSVAADVTDRCETGARSRRERGPNDGSLSYQVDLSANGNRLRFFRTQGTITMDTAGVERVDFNALGGADLVTVNDLTGTDVSDVNVDLAGALGGATGDNAADRVVLNATNDNHTIRLNGDAGAVKVSGLPATINVLHPELANDRLEINTLGDGNKVGAGGLAAGAIQLLVNGVSLP